MRTDEVANVVSRFDYVVEDVLQLFVDLLFCSFRSFISTLRQGRLCHVFGGGVGPPSLCDCRSGADLSLSGPCSSLILIPGLTPFAADFAPLGLGCFDVASGRPLER